MPPREGVSLDDPMVYNVGLGSTMFLWAFVFALRFFPRRKSADAPTEQDASTDIVSEDGPL